MTPVDEAGFQKLVAAHKGKPVVVNFWATWCAPCRAEMPALLEYSKRTGTTLLLVSADEASDAAKASQFLDSVKSPGPRYIKKAADDDKFINSIDPKWSGALPATFVYDRAGRKVRSFFGEVEVKDLEAAVRKL